jgi:hypothetical protein
VIAFDVIGAATAAFVWAVSVKTTEPAAQNPADNRKFALDALPIAGWPAVLPVEKLAEDAAVVPPEADTSRGVTKFALDDDAARAGADIAQVAARTAQATLMSASVFIPPAFPM